MSEDAGAQQALAPLNQGRLSGALAQGGSKCGHECDLLRPNDPGQPTYRDLGSGQRRLRGLDLSPRVPSLLTLSSSFHSGLRHEVWSC